jgi:hypothetical protein
MRKKIEGHRGQGRSHWVIQTFLERVMRFDRHSHAGRSRFQQAEGHPSSVPGIDGVAPQRLPARR